MRYLLLIHSNPATDAPAPADLHDRFMTYTKEIAGAGVMQGGEALQGVETATTVRVRDGERLVTDGPFAETREFVGGYYVIDVPDLDAALEWAARCPGAGVGGIEVRPILEFDAS